MSEFTIEVLQAIGVCIAVLGTFLIGMFVGHKAEQDQQNSKTMFIGYTSKRWGKDGLIIARRKSDTLDTFVSVVLED